MGLPSVDAVTNNFNADSMRQGGGRKALADGTYQWVVKEAQVRTKDQGQLEGCFELNLRVQAVGEDGQGAPGTTKFLGIILPFSNPEIEGHKAPDWAKGMSTKFVATLDPENHVVPRKNPETKQYELNGDIVDKETVDSMYSSSRELVTTQLKNWYTEAAENEGKIPSLVDEAFFGPLETKGEYQNISAFGLSAETTEPVIREFS